MALHAIFVWIKYGASQITSLLSDSLSTDDCTTNEEPRVLGLAMVPGHHIVSIEVDQSNQDAV